MLYTITRAMESITFVLLLVALHWVWVLLTGGIAALLYRLRRPR